MISGPNTGGKTVALKTLGLAAVLHQCGLRPPADEAALPVFDEILVDIGDEQSIAMSLSTFSAHVQQPRRDPRDGDRSSSLVLLDEIAAGTDPVEGAALAEALLGRLATQARLTVTTSHYAELKEWASAADGAANAATGIDPDSDEPLYTVTLGRPGTSHALQTAERLGLPAPIVAAARSRIAPERLRVAELVAEAEAAAREAQTALAAAAAEQQEAEAARLAAEARPRGSSERDRAGAVVGRRRAAARAGARPRRSSRACGPSSRSCAPRSARRASSSASAAAPRPRSRRRRSASATAGSGAASDRAARASRVARAARRAAAADRAARRRATRSSRRRLGVRGTITEIVGDEATVLGSGGLRVRVPLDRLRPRPRRRRGADEPAEPAVTVRAMVQNDLPDEIDLRGRTAQEAREAVRDLVDAAALAGRAEVRVIHGRGTGAVRKAVRDELAQPSARRGAGVGLRRRGDRRAARRALSGRRRPGSKPGGCPASAGRHVGRGARRAAVAERRPVSSGDQSAPSASSAASSAVAAASSATSAPRGREHDEREAGIGRIRLAGDEADPLERCELPGDARGRDSQPARELDAPQRLRRGRLQLEQHGEVVEAEAVMAPERVVDVPQHERAGAGEVEHDDPGSLTYHQSYQSIFQFARTQ